MHNEEITSAIMPLILATDFVESTATALTSLGVPLKLVNNMQVTLMNDLVVTLDQLIPTRQLLVKYCIHVCYMFSVY